MLFTFIPGFLILILIVSIKLFTDHSLYELVSDVSEVGRVHPLAGILSNLGILLWCATASILFFSALSLHNHVSRKAFSFLLSSSVFTGYLLLDDLFLIHEILAPVIFRIDEDIIFLIIIVAVIIYFILFARIIFSTGIYVFLLISIGLLGFSLLIGSTSLKSFIPDLGDWHHLLEEGTKWLGIASWSSYFIMVSFHYIRDHLTFPNDDRFP